MAAAPTRDTESLGDDAGMSVERLGRIRPFMQSYVDDGKLAGITTLIARRGEVVHFESVGMAHTEADLPMSGDTIVRIYSMTKPITSVAVMMLYEQGCLRLNAPVSEYIPEFADLRVYDPSDEAGVAPHRAMTVRDLLTHTSGLSYGWTDAAVDKAYGAAEVRSGTLAEFARKLGDIPLMHHPGATWEYSLSTDVLGYLVQVVSGVPFDEYLAREILGPLGMVDTAFHVTPDKLARFAANYGPDDDSDGLQVIDDPRTGRYTQQPSRPSGGGGLVSTAGDYLRFSQMMLNGGELDGVRLLGRKTVEYMTRDHLPPELCVGFGSDRQPSRGFGLGFSVTRDAAAGGDVGSDGTYAWGGAANTAFWIDPEEDLIAVFLTQFMPNSKYPVVAEFRALVYQAIVD
jgi:CubicO group peptidase (beta-lactamase class C family)